MSETGSTDRSAGGARGAGGRSIALPAVFAALAIAMGFALYLVPNVELVSLTVFASGVVMGRVRGAAVGAIAMAVYSALSPNGSGLAVPPLYAGQVLGMALIGLVGGLTARFWRDTRGRPSWLTALVGGVAGLVLTLVYQSLVVVGLAAAMPQFNQGFLAAVAANAFFSTIHVVSNVVIFAVLSPVLLPRLPTLTARFPRGGVAALLALLLAAGALSLPVDSSARDAEPVPSGERAPDANAAAPADTTTVSARADTSAAVATADTTASMRSDTTGTAAPADSTVAAPGDTVTVPIYVPEPSGHVHDVLSDGVARVLARDPVTRLSGSRWRGHRSSVAMGALPASLTRVTLNGRDFSTWLSGGLDVLAATGRDDGPIHVPEGSDLTLWPWFGPIEEVDRAAPGVPSVALKRWYAPPARPFSRVTMLSGSLGQRAVAAEFGRHYREGSIGLSGAFELRSGRAPVAGGAYDQAAQGGRVVVGADGPWELTIEGGRSEIERGVPGIGGSGDVWTEQVQSSVDAVLTGEDLDLVVFHDEGWLEVSRAGAGRAVASLARDGVTSSVSFSGGPVDIVRLAVAARTASGSALAAPERVLEVGGAVGRRLAVSDRWRVDLSAGWSQMAGLGYPTADATLTGLLGAPSGRARFRVGLSAGGRHPTAIERLAAPAAARAGVALLAGNASLEPTGVVSLRAGWESQWSLGVVGAEGEVARLLRPISVSDWSGETASLDNVDDEAVASLTAWASTGDSLRRGLSVSACARSFDARGSVAALEPVATVGVGCNAWFSHRLFARGYLDVRWEATLSHETGLSRGPWDGLVDDSATTVSLLFAAGADAARVYALLEDAFDQAPMWLPGHPGAGRSFSVGFSWSFWN